jgi:hypothetical protein
MIPALMRVPPTPRSRSGRPMRAISDTRSCWSPSNKKLVIAGLDAAIHHSLKNSFSGWMPGSSPGMTKNCCEIDMRHDRFQAIISGANPIPPGAIRTADRRWPRPLAHVGLGHAARRHVRACRLFKARTATRSRHPGVDARGRMRSRESALPSDSKSPRPVSRRGLNSCDVEDMPVICPTCQISCVVNS